MLSTHSRRLVTVGAVLLTACLFAPVADAATATYMIQEADLLDCPSNCGGGSRYGSSGQPGFQWTDTIPAGSTINTVTIELNHGVQCASSTYNFTGELNGQATDTWMSPAHCSCSVREAIETLDAPAAAYTVGGANEFRMTNVSGPQGYCPSAATLSGAHARITVDYADAGGGAAVPAASTTSIIATIVLLLGASLVFLGRKSA